MPCSGQESFISYLIYTILKKQSTLLPDPPKQVDLPVLAFACSGVMEEDLQNSTLFPSKSQDSVDSLEVNVPMHNKNTTILLCV